MTAAPSDSRPSSENVKFYSNKITVSADQTVSFGFVANRVLIVNGGAGDVTPQFKNNGTYAGTAELTNGDSLVADQIAKDSVKFVWSGVNATVRIWAW